MENQIPQQTQSSSPVFINNPPPIEPKYRNKVWKILGIIFGIIVLILVLLVWYGFYLKKQDPNLSNNFQNNNMSILTVEKIKSLESKIALNVGNDYFEVSPKEQNEIVDMFVKDNSASDSVNLYFAANTARLLNRSKDAMFLFFAAQLRKSFDYQRFELGEADGNNIQTYIGYLNEGAGQGINPLAIQNPNLFSEAIRMIEKWDVIPADDAYYPKEYYGEPKLKKDQWQKVAQEGKQAFLDQFAYKQEKLLSDPKGLEAMQFLQDYNFGKIPHNPVNDQKFKEYLEVFKAIMK